MSYLSARILLTFDTNLKYVRKLRPAPGINLAFGEKSKGHPIIISKCLQQECKH